jgi:hypothetical protein
MLGCESRGEGRQLAMAAFPCILRLPIEASESFETSNFKNELAACLSDETTYSFSCVRECLLGGY